MNLPVLGSLDAPLMLENIPALQQEIRSLAEERDAVILAHNYQLPEIQDVAHYVGDSLGLSQQAAAAGSETIVFCGVHFMAETASILCPDRQVLIPDLDAGCSLADSITAEQLRAWKDRYPGAIVVMYVNTSAEVKAETDYCCTSANAVRVVEHVYREHGPDTEILFGPDMFLGAYVERTLGRSMHVWDGECHVHAGIRPTDISELRSSHPGAELLIHPECGCSTSVMEYVAAGDVDPTGVRMLSTGGMLKHAHEMHGGTAIVATEVGMLHPLRRAAPDSEFIAANEAAHCRYMKMITLPKLRDSLRDGVHEVRVPDAIADRRRGRVLGQQVQAAIGHLSHGSQSHALALEFGRRVAVDVGARAHLQGVPESARLVDPFQPGHAVVGRRHQDDDELRTALSLLGRAALVGQPGASEQGPVKRPAITEPIQVSTQLSAIDTGCGQRETIVAPPPPRSKPGSVGGDGAHHAGEQNPGPVERWTIEKDGKGQHMPIRRVAQTGQVRHPVERAGLGQAAPLGPGVEPDVRGRAAESDHGQGRGQRASHRGGPDCSQQAHHLLWGGAIRPRQA
jgi:quinolinate synthase